MSEAGEKKEARSALFGQGIRYVVVGFSSVGIELALFYIFFEFAALDVVLSNVVSITLATAYNFYMSRTWTFKSISSLPRTVVLYLVLFAWNQTFSSFALIGLMDLGIYFIFAKVITMAAIVCWNFVLYRKVVFI